MIDECVAGRVSGKRSSTMSGLSSRVAAASIPALVVVAVLTVSGCGNVTQPEFEYAAAQHAVERWVEQHQGGWSLTLRSSRVLTRPEWSRPCADSPDSGFTTLRHATAGTEIDLLFRCPVGPGASVDELAAAFAFVVLQELPHGIRSPGWRFRVLTPSSSISEQVTFSTTAAGRMRVEIETPLYAVHGHSEREACRPMVDGPSAEGCYLGREHRVPLSLTLEVPFQGSELN
jgi:hypothetical protein